MFILWWLGFEFLVDACDLLTPINIGYNSPPSATPTPKEIVVKDVGKPSGTKAHQHHYDDVIMGAIASLITSLTIVYSTVYSDADQRKYQSSASLAFVWGIHRGPVNSPHKWPVTRKMFPFDDVIMIKQYTSHVHIFGDMTETTLAYCYVKFEYKCNVFIKSNK